MIPRVVVAVASCALGVTCYARTAFPSSQRDREPMNAIEPRSRRRRYDLTRARNDAPRSDDMPRSDCFLERQSMSAVSPTSCGAAAAAAAAAATRSGDTF